MLRLVKVFIMIIKDFYADMISQPIFVQILAKKRLKRNFRQTSPAKAVIICMRFFDANQANQIFSERKNS